MIMYYRNFIDTLCDGEGAVSNNFCSVGFICKNFAVVYSAFMHPMHQIDLFSD